MAVSLAIQLYLPKRQKEAYMADQKNSGNFANDRKRASEAGKKGAQHESTEAKRRGGENSHKNR